MERTIARFRQFNRFYTGLLGLLNRSYLHGDITLAEARVLFEIGDASGTTLVSLADLLKMDRGQLSRILSKFENRGWMRRTPRPEDRRSAVLSLTAAGRAILSEVIESANTQASELLGALPDEASRRRLGEGMVLIQALLGHAGKATLREGRPGDLGWILRRHADYYGQEYGFDESFEGYVLDGMAAYVRREKNRRGIFIAEIGELPVGAIALVEAERGWGQLRWFYVEPWSQGKGLGRRLMERAMEYAAERGFKGVLLWTFAALAPARHLYISQGFRLAESRTGRLGGQAVVEERWEKFLA